MSESRTLVLVDNGSLRPEATLGLRRLAAALESRLSRPVRAVSLLHSSGVAPAALGGVPADILEPWVRREATKGPMSLGILPLFLGRSGAVTDYIPARIEAMREDFPGLDVAVAPVLSEATPEASAALAGILARGVREVLRSSGWDRDGARPAVVVVDHGTPVREVSALRDDVAAELAAILGAEVGGVWPASMERRDGDQYAFNEPLLARILRHPSLLAAGDGKVVVAMFFLLPGRHAGPGGDVATIIEEARREVPLLEARMTPLLAEDPALLDLLAASAAALPP